MLTALLVLLRSIGLICRGHRAVALENLALRQQLAVLRRTVKRPQLRTSDRLFWILLAKVWRAWRGALIVVQPDTVVRWHRQWLRRQWWKVGGRLQWLWAFATPDTTVYRIQPGRGFEEAAAVLGADFAGVLVRDGWAPYRQFTAAAHQTCLAHLLRRCRLIAADHPHTTFATDVQAILHQALAVRDRHLAGVVSAHGLAVVRGQLITRLADRLDRSSAANRSTSGTRLQDAEMTKLVSLLRAGAPDVELAKVTFLRHS